MAYRLEALAGAIPGWIAGHLVVAASLLAPTARPIRAWRTMYAKANSLSNAVYGWPAAAFAGALSIEIGAFRRRSALAVVRGRKAPIDQPRCPPRDDAVRVYLRPARGAGGRQPHLGGVSLLSSLKKAFTQSVRMGICELTFDDDRAWSGTIIAVIFGCPIRTRINDGAFNAKAREGTLI